MRILVFSDIHGDLAALHRLMEIDADYYIAAGDLVNWGRGLSSLGPVLQRRAPQVYVLPGNHENEAHIDELCREFGLNPLHGRSFQAGPYHIAGLGHSNPTPFNTPGEYSEAEIASKLAPFAALDPLILICHCPPLNTPLDRAAPGRHFGSSAVHDYLLAHPPLWFLCGHIHEAAGTRTAFGNTQAANVGKQGFVLELPGA